MQTQLSSNSFGVLRKTGATALLFATLLYIPLTAQAWKVTVENPLKKVNDTAVNFVSVTFYYGLGIYSQSETIRPGTSHTFETGLACPNGLKGKIMHSDNTTWVAMQGTDMYGTWYGEPNDGAAACWDNNMVICAMPEGSSKPYSFCKK